MSIGKPHRNLFKIPHIPLMSYEDIVNFEKNGVTPRGPSQTQEGSNGSPEEQDSALS